jgi:RNA polymerase sigma-70 factor, ECF subfamily
MAEVRAPLTPQLAEAPPARVDRDALQRLLESRYSSLLLLIRRKTRDAQLAADLLNDAVVITLDHLQQGRIEQHDALAGYVFKVAINLYQNHQRKYSRRDGRHVLLENVDAALMPSHAPNPDAAALAHLVQEILSGLPTERDRVLLRRFYLDEDDKQVICRDLAISAANFDRVIFRARQRMKSLLQARKFAKGDL